MAAWKLAPALATRLHRGAEAGRRNAAVRASTRRTYSEAGFPQGVVNIITGFGETAGAALAAHPRVDKVAFTGSTEVGKAHRSGGGERSEESVARTGGKSPNIVFRDADLDLGHRGGGQCHLLQSRSVLLRRVTTVSCERVDLSTNSLAALPIEPRRSRSVRGSIPKRDGPDGLRK